jgi:hypothetical protein
MEEGAVQECKSLSTTLPHSAKAKAAKASLIIIIIII